MDSALAVNTECGQLSAVAVRVVLRGRLGFADVVARKVVLGGVGRRVVGLAVEEDPGHQRRSQLEEDEARERDPDHELHDPAADHAGRLSSWRVSTVSSSTRSARAMRTKETIPAVTEARTLAASSRPRVPPIPIET